MKIIMPMLGRGSKFIQEGITTPKPLIKIRGRFMIDWALDPIRNLDLERDAVFLIRKDHNEQYDFKKILQNLVGKKAVIKVIEQMPQGAAKTVLLLRKEINNDEELIVYNADQFFKWNTKSYIRKWRDKVDGIIPIFHATHPKWSFVETDKNLNVVRTAEKEIISNKATVGFFYFRKGEDFVWAADQMIKKNLMVNGEYYVCPVYNELIEKGKKIKASLVDEMWSFGTPEDVERFDKYYKGDL